MSGALDSAWLTLLEARRYNASKNGLMVEDKWNGDGRSRNTANEESLSGKLTAIARSSELKLRCLQNELAEAGGDTGATDGGLYAYGPPVWESYQSLTKVPKIFKTLARNDGVVDWSANACFQGPHRSAADLVRTTSVGECRNGSDSEIDKRDGANCTFCTFCNSPEEHWEHFRHKHRTMINSSEVSAAAQRAASARSIYNRWSRYNAVVQRGAATRQFGSASGIPAVSVTDSDNNRVRHSDHDSILGDDTRLATSEPIYGGRYKVCVRTGKIGTNLKARIKLVGTEGSSTFGSLRRGPSTRPFHFYSETTEVFFLPFKSLGEIKSCYLQIEGRSGQQWFLEEIVVVDLKLQRAWSFNVHLTLAMTEGHRMITFEVRPKERKTTQAYEITIVTGKVNFAGTDAGVSLTMFGRRGASEKLSLRQSVSGKKPFKMGQTDVFNVNTTDIGDLTRIRIEHDNRGAAPGWYLDKVEIKEINEPKGSNRSWLFPCNQWIAEDEGDRQLCKDLHALPQQSSISRPLPPGSSTAVMAKRSPRETTPRFSLAIYELLVETGASSFANQNVNIFVQIFGTNGRSNEIWFSAGSSSRFEKGCRDKLCLETTNVGTIRELRIGHDHVGYGSGWLLEKVNVKKYFTPQEIHDFRRVIRRRIELADRPSYEYNATDATLFDDEDEGKGFRDPDEYEEFKSKRLEVAANRVPVYEEYKFECGQWLAVDEDGSGSKTETILRPKSSKIMFRDLSEQALADEKRSFDNEDTNARYQKQTSARKSKRKTKVPRDKTSGLEESKITRTESDVKVVEQIKAEPNLRRRPRSSSQPRGSMSVESEGITMTSQMRPKSSFSRADLPPRPTRRSPGRPSSAERRRRGVLYSDDSNDDGDDDELEEHFGMSSSSTSREGGRPFSASSTATPPYIHMKARTPIYATYKGKEIIRFPVPDEKVSWNVEFKEYNAIDWTCPDMMGPWVDPDVRVDRNYKLKYNFNDGKVNRQSHMGEYKLTDNREHHGGVPLNPMGRTGLRGRGRLGRWGPNHAGDPIVTRWKRNERNIVQMHPKTGKPILQFVAIRRKDTGEWAIPGGMVDAGENIGTTLKREFTEEALSSLGDLDELKKANIRKLVDLFFQPSNGREIYRGYVDDPRNTDNAWMETVAVNFHDESGTSVGRLPLKAGDDAAAVRWADIGSDVKLYASHSSFLQKVVRHLNAHW